MRVSMSMLPAEYCSMTSLTSYGRSASLNLRRAMKNLILRIARMARLCTSVSCVRPSRSSKSSARVQPQQRGKRSLTTTAVREWDLINYLKNSHRIREFLRILKMPVNLKK